MFTKKKIYTVAGRVGTSKWKEIIIYFNNWRLKKVATKDATTTNFTYNNLRSALF